MYIDVPIQKDDNEGLMLIENDDYADADDNDEHEDDEHLQLNAIVFSNEHSDASMYSNISQ